MMGPYDFGDFPPQTLVKYQKKCSHPVIHFHKLPNGDVLSGCGACSTQWIDSKSKPKPPRKSKSKPEPVVPEPTGRKFKAPI